MARTKKVVEQKEEIKEKPVDYGTGMTRINNLIMAGEKVGDLREEKRK